MSDIFISIQLNSNRPEQIKRFLDAVETTADKPEAIEVLIHVDADDAKTQHSVQEEMTRSTLCIRMHQSNLIKQGFPDLWKPLNELLALTNPSAYFIMNASDEFIFQTTGWDSALQSYKHFYPDDIFRVRCSQFRYRNYQDVWECGFAPDSLAFYTKRWMDIVGQWAPCIGPDSFHQCIAYYLSRYDPFGKQYYRDIAEPHMQFTGEGASNGLIGKKYLQVLRMHYREWFKLMSHGMQQQAKQAAMQLAAHLKAHELNVSDYHIADAPDTSTLTLVSEGQKVTSFHYGLSAWKIALRNGYRTLFFHYYGGGGAKCLWRWNPILEAIYMLWCRFDWVYRGILKGVKYWVKYRLPLANRFKKYI